MPDQNLQTLSECYVGECSAKTNLSVAGPTTHWYIYFAFSMTEIGYTGVGSSARARCVPAF